MKLFNQTILSRVAHLSALCSRTAVRLCIYGCLLLLFAACSKNQHNDDNEPVNIDDIDVYMLGVVGNYSNGNYSNGNYDNCAVKVWKNGELLYDILNYVPFNSLNDRFSGRIAVSGNDVYVAGAAVEKVAEMHGTYIANVWKNGEVLYPLSFPPLSPELRIEENTVSAITVTGNDVYVAGNLVREHCNRTGVAYVWKNGEVLYTLADDAYDIGVFSMVVSGNDVYLAGNMEAGSGNVVAMYWKNGVAYPLANNARAYDIAVSGNDVYVTGYIPNNGGRIDQCMFGNPEGRTQVYWKNGVLNIGPCTTCDASDCKWRFSNVEVVGNTVYMACEGSVKLYKDGLLFSEPAAAYLVEPVKRVWDTMGSTVYIVENKPCLLWAAYSRRPDSLHVLGLNGRILMNLTDNRDLDIPDIALSNR